MGGVLGSIVSAGSNVAMPKVATPQRVRVSSGVQSGLLVRKVQPTYPPLARQARIQGTVVLQAQISKNGDIENLQLISGHPMLAPAAIEAVKQWKYKPYLLNGEPVEVETTVQVNFSLAGS
jgi:protein TonB